MQGAYPSGIFPGIKLERSVIKKRKKKVNLETTVAAVGVHWAANRPVCPYSLSITSSLCPPPHNTLVAFIMTQKASNTSFLYAQAAILQ